MGRVSKSKYIYPLFLLLCILFSIIPILLAFDLIGIKEYVAFQDILHKWYIDFSYFAKVIIANIDYFNFSFSHLLVSLLSSLSFMNILLLVCIFYLIAAMQEEFMKLYNKKWIALCVIYLITYLLIGGIIITGFSLTTLNDVISLFQYGAYIMIIGHAVIIILAIYYGIQFLLDLMYNKKIR